jgi:hypothetical protein
MINLNIQYTIIILILVILFGFYLLHIIPPSNNITHVDTFDPISQEYVNKFNIFNYFNNPDKNKTADEIIKNTPDKTIDQICRKQKIKKLEQNRQEQKENYFVKEEVILDDNLPWDEQIDECKNMHGTIDDINWKAYTYGYRPKIILY